MVKYTSLSAVRAISGVPSEVLDDNTLTAIIDEAELTLERLAISWGAANYLDENDSDLKEAAKFLSCYFLAKRFLHNPTVFDWEDLGGGTSRVYHRLNPDRVQQVIKGWWDDFMGAFRRFLKQHGITWLARGKKVDDEEDYTTYERAFIQETVEDE